MAIIHSSSRWELIHTLISNARRIVLSTHVNPDGDGLGSQAALYHFLKGRDKECRILNPSPLPDTYEFLGESTRFESYDRSVHSGWLMDTDLAIIFDVGDYRRLSQLGKELRIANMPILSLDHHPHPEPNRFTYHVHDISACSTGYLVYEYIKYAKNLARNGSDLPREISEALYTALVTDTGSFRFNNTSAASHEMASELIRTGIKPYDIYRKVYESSSLERIRLLGAVLKTLHLDGKGRLAWFTVTRQMMDSVNARRDDTSGFTDFVRSIRGVEVSLMIHEIGDERCRVNFRSKGRVRIDDLSRRLGGGGHPFAAGAMVDLPIDQCAEYVVAEAVEEIRSQLGNLGEV